MTGTELVTPTVRATARRVSFWFVAVLVIIAVAAGMLVAQRAADRGGVLDPASPAPDGSLALAEVLRQHGVEVVATESLDATADAVARAGADGATVLYADIDHVLVDEQLERLAEVGARLVAVEPGLTATRLLAPGLGNGGAIDGGFEADCALRAVRNAGEVDGSGTGYRILEGAATGCLAGDDRYGLVALADRELVVLGLGDVLTNDRVDEAGNAALALTLLGERETLVWYLPGADDYRDAGGIPTLTELSPSWLTPVALLAILVAVAAALWRGRRLGPLVVERLPVTVRASETMEGRARLYARSAARDHALDALRIGTVARLAARCGLPHTATVDEVVAVVAAATDRPAPAIRELLVDARPQSDRELVALSDRLLLLERDVDAATRPG